MTTCQETFDYLGLTELSADQLEDALSYFMESSIPAWKKCFPNDANKRVFWNGSALGEFIADKATAIKKGVRHVSYQRMEPLAFNSATVGIPLRESTQSAYVIARTLAQMAHDKASTSLEELCQHVAWKAFANLCKYYGVSTSDSEILFDDNATMTTFQLLSLLKLKPHDHILTFFDTGRVMPDALSGRNPEFLPDNFKPAIDIWNNHKIVRDQHTNIGPYKIHLIHHYLDAYRPDSELCQELCENLKKHKIPVIIIPTVTRLGRRLDFIGMCLSARAASRDIGVETLILLDDCQGLLRLEEQRYHEKGVTGKSNLWDYCDGLILTGAKVCRALMGSGAILMSAKRLGSKLKAIKQSPLLYRARRYGYVSENVDRVNAHNRFAPHYAQIPELASLVSSLDCKVLARGYPTLRSLRKHIVSRLKDMPNITVLESSSREVKFVDSIISFFLNSSPRGGSQLKECLGSKRPGNHVWDELPITIPAIVTADKRDYMRIALDPRSCIDDPEYPEKVDYVLDAIQTTVNHL